MPIAARNLFRPLAAAAAFFAAAAFGRPVCVDGACYFSEEAARAAGVSEEAIAKALAEPHGEEEPGGGDEGGAAKKGGGAEEGKGAGARRLAMGYMDAGEFAEFLKGGEKPAEGPLDGKGLPAVLAIVLVGGLLANLTPCVLPLVPVNLALVGRGWKRGAAYGAGIAVSYGALGLAAAFGAAAFGAVQSSPWFNAAAACAFAALGLAMSGAFRIDLAKYRPRPTAAKGGNRGLFGVFLFGAGSAVLAGACVEPILLATLALTVKWHAAGKAWAVALPFVLGLGMAAPWPFAAAGLSALPKPGAWMRWVNRLFAAVFFALAAWYGNTAREGFAARSGAGAEEAGRFSATPETWAETYARAKGEGKPVLVDVWAGWCKNCIAMEKNVFPKVARELGKFTVVKLRAEDPADLGKIAEFAGLDVKGLPAFVIIGPDAGNR